MRALSAQHRSQLESAVLEGRRGAEAGVRAAISALGVNDREKPAHLGEEPARLRRGLRAKQRQLGGEDEVLVWDAAYEQWHKLLFARFLAENGLLRHPEFGAPVTLQECEELAQDLGEPDGWSVAARFAADILPGIFRLNDPCVQLRLAPEHRVALERILARLPSEVFLGDDSLGWVYQYWQSERKDQVNDSEVKIGGADLGPVTQLFTENYMVRFLLENSLGAWWAARHPDSPLVRQFEYLRLDDDGQPAAGRFDAWPDRVAEVTVMDPCCGSGHFLVEAFGMLWRMRAEEEGLGPVAAQDAVLRHNLFGLELDPRCVQIAMFAIALTAWKQGGGWRKLPTPNIACSGIPAKAQLDEWTALAKGDDRLKPALERLHTLFKDADTLGSLIDPRRAAEASDPAGRQRSFEDVEFDKIAPLLEQAASRETYDPATAVLGADAAGIARAANLLSGTYSLVATNVPFLSRAKQSAVLRHFGETYYRDSMADISTMFLRRSLAFSVSVALVTPQNWHHQRSYARLRDSVLSAYGYLLMARLGNNCWQNRLSNPLFKFHTVLSIISTGRTRNCIAAIDLGDGPINEKPAGLKSAQLSHLPVAEQRKNPEARLMMQSRSLGQLLEECCSAYTGIQTGDSARYIRYWWEVSDRQGWIMLQSTALETHPYTGRQYALDWDEGIGDLSNEPGAYLRNTRIWGSNGIAVKQMGDLHATIYTGEAFDNNVAVLLPRRQNDLVPIWAFVSSPEYARLVRRINPRPGVTTADLVKVPFDVERWRRVAAEQYPDGLPEASSDNPTQWLFMGHPEVAKEPLQVAVGRLVGYRWPEQPDADDLADLADDDGIICLPAVSGELPAANRLQTLLARAYGEAWSPALLRKLIDQADSRNKDLVEWLRDDFFSRHCSVFSNRPFVWHIWDGRKDGFSALVNYHRLHRAGLEKLTYTYLGDWIERQRADAADDVVGADLRLAAAQELKGRLEAILKGEPPYDIYVRWKPLHEQPIGWEPDLDDGIRLNIRPFVMAGVLRSRVNVNWNKDRGKNSDGSERLNDAHFTIAEREQARGKNSDGSERLNDAHFTIAEREQAREKARRT